MERLKRALRLLSYQSVGMLPTCWQLRFYDLLLRSARFIAPSAVKPASKAEHLVRFRRLEFTLPVDCVAEINRIATGIDTQLHFDPSFHMQVFTAASYASEAAIGKRYFELITELDSCHDAIVIGLENDWADIPSAIREMASSAGNVLFVSLTSCEAGFREGNIQSISFYKPGAIEVSLESSAFILANMLIQRAPMLAFLPRDGALHREINNYHRALDKRSRLVLFP